MNITDSMKKIGIIIKDEKDFKKFIDEKNKLLNAFDEFELDDLEPMYHLNEVNEDSLRKDEIKTMDRKDMLVNAVRVKDNFVVIKGDK